MSEYETLQQSVEYREFLLDHLEYLLETDIVVGKSVEQLMAAGKLFKQFLAEMYSYA